MEFALFLFAFTALWWGVLIAYKVEQVNVRLEAIQKHLGITDAEVDTPEQ